MFLVNRSNHSMLLYDLDKVCNHKEKKCEGKCVAKNCGFPATIDRIRVLVRRIAWWQSTRILNNTGNVHTS